MFLPANVDVFAAVTKVECLEYKYLNYRFSDLLSYTVSFCVPVWIHILGFEFTETAVRRVCMHYYDDYYMRWCFYSVICLAIRWNVMWCTSTGCLYYTKILFWNIFFYKLVGPYTHAHTHTKSSKGSNEKLSEILSICSWYLNNIFKRLWGGVIPPPI